MAIRSNGLDTTDAKTRAANDIDNDIGLAAWASGKRNFENTPGGGEFVKSSGTGIGPRQIPVSQALTDQDKADIEAGNAVVTIPHNAQLSDKDRTEIEAGRAVVLPEPIPQDQADSLSAKQLADIAAGRAAFVPSSAPAPTEFAKGRDGRVEVPGSRLHEALDSGVASLEDIAAGRVKVL